MKRSYFSTPAPAAVRVWLGMAALFPAMIITGPATEEMIIHDTGRVIVNSELTVNQSGVGDGELLIEAGGTLSGCGIINANITNQGTILADCGAGTFLIVNGDLTNDGTTTITNGTELQVSGTLRNNPTGTLDTRGGSMTAGVFTDLGTYLFDGGGFIKDIELVSYGIDGADFSVTAITLSTKHYVMQVSTDLQPLSWLSVGFPQAGTDGEMTFIHPGGATTPGGKQFYRIIEAPAP